MFRKRSITLLLILSIVSSTFYLPVFTPKVQAVLGVADTGFDIPTIIEQVVDKVAMPMAQMMIDNIVKSTVEWAQSGFEGNPAYAVNPKQYFTDIADGIAGNFIAGSDLNFLCSPFQTQVRLALQKSYVQLNPFQCTLTGAVGNIDAFYNDFSQGGWDGWFAMTQNDLNNPYGAFLETKIELDSRIASAIGIKNQQLDWNQGFLSYEKCPEGQELDPLLGTGDCKVEKITVTPGATIKAQLDKVLPSGMEKLISAQHIEQLVSSFATGLLNRYVFGSKGLFASNSSSGGGGSGGASSNVTSRTGNIDIDNDSVPDGMDLDYDGKLESSTDVCHHGGRPPTCVGSKGLQSSPYFTPICQALDKTVIALTDFTTFMDTYADQMEDGGKLKGAVIGGILTGPVGLIFGGFFGHNVDNFKNKADAEIWFNRHSEVETAVGDILSQIRSRSSTFFDELEITTNRYNNYIGKVQESLIKDQDLDLARRGNGGGGLENLMKHSAYNLRYFKEVKTRIGKCENPNISGINDIPTPPPVEGGPGDGGGSGGHDTCEQKGLSDNYQSDVRSAANEYLASHPEIANLPSGDASSGGSDEGIAAVAQLRDGTIVILKNRGFNAKTILDPTGAPYPQMVSIWKSGDPDTTDYRVTAGGGIISAAIQAGYCGGHSTFEGVDIIPGGQPTSLLSDLQAERAKYPASVAALCPNGTGLQPESCPLGRILNVVAWKNKDRGWGVSRKTGGHRCPSPAGEISCDILQISPSLVMYDVFGSSETNATPKWDIAGQPNPPDPAKRPWVAPAQP